ncbi:MAG: secondary thiamine-phosphate synthase enzyme YjbQ [Planctomycetes bacterium]|nr:secondary thiamine-phosphate synthase enzyme YjbQ [Planctomycetota bacterium]
MYRDTLEIQTPGRGLHDITGAVRKSIARSGVRSGLCHLFLRHTSASLLITENADPSVRHDLEYFFYRIAPDGDSVYTHNAEGPDDMPSHIRAALTRVSETVIVEDGAPLLGTWQGIFLFEHRRAGQRRILELRIHGDAKEK